MSYIYEPITWQQAVEYVNQGKKISTGVGRAPLTIERFSALSVAALIKAQWFLERELVTHAVVGTTVGTWDSAKTVAMRMLATTPWGNLLEHPENAPTHYAISIAETEAPCSNTETSLQPST